MKYDGRMTSSIDSMGRETKYEYVAEKRPEISKITYSDGTTTTYNYDTTTWRLLSVTDANGNVTTYNYDENGNAIGSSMAANGLALNSATTEYSGSYILSATDVLGNTTNYNYSENRGILNSVTDASGVVTSYTYNDSNDYLTNVSAAGSEVDYTYSYGKLVSISHNTDSNSANDVTYNFVYDEFGNTSSVKVGTQALITHAYGANNGLLTQSTYGNGDTYTPTYDSLDRITAVSYNGIEKYNWIYGADGNIGLHNDLVNDVTWRYEYTKDGSVTSAYASNGERFDYTYDTATGKLLSATVSDGATSKTVTYNYSDHTNGEKANLIESVVLPNATVTYEYDDFYRASYDVAVSGCDILTTDYTFLSGTEDNSTTFMVGSMTNAGNGWSDTLSYTYDCKGNIETISENGEQKAKYYYDDLNQLVREDNAWLGKTIAYTYDNGGNILSVEEYTLTSASDISSLVASSTDTYTYGDSNWKDKLTSFNGNEITYDEIGNPLSYYNGLTFGWQRGRQLAGITGDNLSVSYKYNSSGIRTEKAVNGVTTTYTLEGSNVVKETNGTDAIWYYYDAAGELTGLELNGTPYFYVSNYQGDIVAITDENGDVVVEYLYDSWGKLISITGSHADAVGIKNPHRYRGYYYDTETGLYYLNSRYYDSNTKRFINADGYATTGQSILGHNMFAYCLNSPTNYIDSTGRKALSINNFNPSAMLYGSSGSYSSVSDYVQYTKSNNSKQKNQGGSKTSPPPLVKGTIAIGTTVGIAPFLSVSISVAVDDSGNVTWLGGFTFSTNPAIDTNLFVSYTNAPNVGKLTGWSKGAGASVSIKSVSIGYESISFEDSNNPKIKYSGGTVSFSSAGSFVDAHLYGSYSWDLVDVFTNPENYFKFYQIETRGVS